MSKNATCYSTANYDVLTEHSWAVSKVQHLSPRRVPEIKHKDKGTEGRNVSAVLMNGIMSLRTNILIEATTSSFERKLSVRR